MKNKKTLKSLKKVEKPRGFGQMVRLGESMLGNTSYKRKIGEKSYDIEDLWFWLVLRIVLDSLH